jgi:hypothetical protein
MTRSTAALVCAATAILQRLSGPSLVRCPSRKWMAATSSMLFPVPKGPCTTHRGLAACMGHRQMIYSIGSAATYGHRVPFQQNWQLQIARTQTWDTELLRQKLLDASLHQT